MRDSLLPELDDEFDTHAALLGQIHALGKHIRSSHPIGPMPHSELSPIRRRTWLYMAPRLWHNSRQYMVWLHLYNPLWLGEDGIVYREYESICGNSFMMRAEIEQRDEEGLRRVLSALQKLDSCNTASPS